MQRLGDAIGDGMIVARRNVIKIKRVPEILVSALIQPLTMIVVFGYVFGGAINIPGGNYRQFLIGGVFALTVTFGASFTAAGLADDMQKGIIDRFRSLPMSRSAVVLGRTASDLVLTTISLLVMGLAGLAVGWRTPNGIGSALAGFALLLLYAYALSWIMAYVGLRVRSVETVNNAAMIVIFPQTFAANTMVPADTLPGWLRRRVEPGLRRHPGRKGDLRQHPGRHPRTNSVAAPEPCCVHPHLRRCDPRRLRAAVHPSLRQVVVRGKRTPWSVRTQ